MDEERRRILRMMAEGTISVEECDELLRALSDRRKEKTEKEVQAAQAGSRPIWPYVLLVVLAILAVPVFLAAWTSALRVRPGQFGPMAPFYWIPITFLVRPFSGAIRILLFIFWVWMIVDCLSRLPWDFRLLFTTQHKYEKWIWLAITIFTGPLGALAYFIIIRQPARRFAPPSSEQKPPAPPERPLRPSRRARSIKPLIIIIVLLAIAAPIIIFMVPQIIFMFIGHHWMGPDLTVLAVGIIPGVILLLAGSIFWIWMLIDCLARDYREFGTLITSDKSADKLLWLLLILFTFIIGALAYHISIRRQPIPTG